MFRKIVTELAYSPALAGNLGGYIKRLRDERSRRQIGLIFIFLALVVQLFATLLPPESANSNNPTVLIDEGVRSIDDYLGYYDQNTKNIRDLLTSLGITRSDIKNATEGPLPSTEDATIWFMHNTRSDDSFAYSFHTSSSTLDIAFHQPLGSPANTSEVFVGKTSQPNEWFAIAKDSGNLITKTDDMSTCPAQFSTAVDAQSMILCPPTLESALSARTIGSSTAPDMAHASDRTAYTLTVTNKGDRDASIAPAINLEDVLEYSRILDYGGGEYDYDTKMLSWPTVSLAAGGSTERSFIVQLLPTIPSTAQGEYVTASYDCRVRVTFGNSITTPVNCPFVKRVERLTNSLIKLSTKANLTFAFCLVVIGSYLYIRSRQLLTELYIIRHNHLGGL
jgi:hypothetical protein